MTDKPTTNTAAAEAAKRTRATQEEATKANIGQIVTRMVKEIRALGAMGDRGYHTEDQHKLIFGTLDKELEAANAKFEKPSRAAKGDEFKFEL